MVRYRHRPVTSATYFDGRTSRGHAVSLAVSAGHLRLAGDVDLQVPLSAVRFGEQLGSAARRIELPDGAYCAISDPSAADALMRAAGHSAHLVDRAQRSWGLALAALLLTVVALLAGWRWGLPALADLSSRLIPAAAVSALSQQTLDQLDRKLLRPTQLTASRQRQLRNGFARLGGRPEQLLFRHAEAANAFALPDGRVVLLDPLVALADNDEQILAVLAHERGHVAARHGLRLMIQGSVTAGLLSALVGDVSSLLATAPAVLLNARYSREFETEADALAVLSLRAGGMSPESLATMLEKLQRSEGQKEAGDSFLSSHPAPRERIMALRRP